MKKETAIFALGCFWGVQSYFDKVDGVLDTQVGYTGGEKLDPTYESLGNHTEAIEIIYDADIVSYSVLIDHFFNKRNPIVPAYKEQYKSAVYYLDDSQKEIIASKKQDIQKNYEDSVSVEIISASIFYRAEEYHQKYSQKHGGGLC